MYARIQTLLRHEFIAIQWKVQLEEEKHRLVIERRLDFTFDEKSPLMPIARLAPELLNDVEGVKLEAGFFGAENGVDVKKETSPLREDDPILVPPNGNHETLPIDFGRDYYDDDIIDGEDDDDAFASSWRENEDDDGEASPAKRKRKKTKIQQAEGKEAAELDGEGLHEDEDSDYEETSLKSKKKKKAEPALCTICHKYFSSKYYLTKHSLNRHNVDLSLDDGANGVDEPAVKPQRVCVECDLIFATKAELLQHLQTAHDVADKEVNPGKVKLWRCKDSRCDGKRVFTTRVKLRKHTKAVHGVPEKPTCTECGATFESNAGRSKHMKSEHAGVRISCLHCDKVSHCSSCVRGG